MGLKLNKAIMFQLVAELFEAVSRSGKSRDKILREIANSHPEITYTSEEWEPIPDAAKEKIIDRVRRTLNSIA